MQTLTEFLAAMVFVLAGALIVVYRQKAMYMRTEIKNAKWRVALLDANHECGHLLAEQQHVIVQFGQMLARLGAELEHSGHNLQESFDMQSLGKVIISMQMEHAQVWDIGTLSDGQEVLRELGARYGIEPACGGPYTLRRLVLIAEQVVHNALPNRNRRVA